MRESGDAGAGAAVDLVAFRVGAQEFCVDIMAVREIRGWSPTTTLPHALPFVRDAVDLRGAVLPVVDLSARLGLGAAAPTARHVTIVARLRGQAAGLLVDAVSDILTVDAGAIGPTPEVGSDVARRLVTDVLAVEGRLIGKLDLDAVAPDVARDAA